MKKLLFILLIICALAFTGCSTDETDKYSSDLRLTVTHIDEDDGAKSIHIRYPVFGGIQNQEALTNINTSIYNYVNSQYEEFNDALSESSTDVFSDSLTSSTTQVTESNSEAEDSGDSEGSEGSEDYEDTDTTDNSGSAEAATTEESADTSVSGETNPISLDMKFKITYNRNNYICVVQSYEKSLGEDLTFSGQHSFLFSLKNATYISLYELFDFDSGFRDYVNDIIQEQVEDSGIVTYNEDISVSISKTSHFYIDKNNLYIYYDAMELGPSKNEIPTFVFSLRSVKEYLNENFKDLV